MVNQRLVTGGCSCTRHCWPSWADYLGQHFSGYVNTANAGADNATIARNIIDTAKSGDLVIVQWTGFDRFNKFLDHETPNYYYDSVYNSHNLIVEQCGMDQASARGTWHYSGTVVYDTIFLKHYYSPIERFRNTLDYVRMVVMDSQLKGYQLWNFTMTDWFLGETETIIDPRLVKMHEREQFLNFYLNSNILRVRDELGYTPINHKYSKGDTHPQPVAHWNWVKNHIAPIVGIDVDLSIADQVQLDQLRVEAGIVN